MKTMLTLLLLATLGSVGLLSAFAAAPAKVDDTAPIADLLVEVDGKIERLDQLLESAEKFEAAKDKDVIQSFVVLTVMGQAVAEHRDKDKAKFSGPALREAARKFQPEGSYDDARAALEAVKMALSGEGATDAASDYDWAMLVPMHPMMEEINARNAKLVPIFRRPRGRPEEPVHASTIAVLTLAMHADTHTVKDKADIPQWQAWCDEYRVKMAETAAAIRAQDGKKGRELFDSANAICDQCHEKFRDAE